MTDSIDVLLDRFLQTKNSYNTQRAYRSDISQFFVFVWVYTISHLTQYSVADMQSLVYRYLESKSVIANRDIAVTKNSKTINRKAYALSSFFDYLVKMYGYKQNPLCLYQPLKEDKNSNTSSLNRGELIELLKYGKSLVIKTTHKKKRLIAMRNYLMLCFLAMSLRRQEVVSVRWNQIVEKNWQQCIVIRQKWWSYKTLPLPLNMIKYLQIFRKINVGENTGNMNDNEKNDNYMFQSLYERYNNKKNHISSNYLYDVVKRYCKKLNICKNITPHSLRKTFIELALNNNENFINICNATGHSNVDLIRYYDTRSSIENNAIHSVMKGVI